MVYYFKHLQTTVTSLIFSVAFFSFGPFMTGNEIFAVKKCELTQNLTLLSFRIHPLINIIILPTA